MKKDEREEPRDCRCCRFYREERGYNGKGTRPDCPKYGSLGWDMANFDNKAPWCGSFKYHSITRGYVKEERT